MNEIKEEIYNKFLQIGLTLNKVELSQMFGKKCYKYNGKAFICYFKDSLVCKLDKNTISEVLSLSNTELFDPSLKNRPMKERVVIPYEHYSIWQIYATKALNYIMLNN